MSDPYPLLTPGTVAAYLESIPGVPAVPADAPVTELSDGNLNLVFRVGDGASAGLVVKQALPYVRVDPSWPMTPERARHEAEALAAHGAVTPDYVPAIYGFDPERFVVVMEDLFDHVVWRTALSAGERHDGVAGDLGRYLGRIAFSTSVLGLDPVQVKDRVARSVNPQLCQITEDLVFTEPYVDHPHNRVLPENEPDVAELAADPVVRAAMGRAKLAFMTRAEALLHGDLHTSSVMVRAAAGEVPRSTRAIDSEFAFYGPIGFDLGMLWANLYIAAARSLALGRDEHAAWCLRLPTECWQAFEGELRSLWPQRHDPRVFGDDVLDAIVRQIGGDAVVAAAAECARRVIGFAKAADLESLPTEQRAGAARGVLRSARMLAHAGAMGDQQGLRELSARVGELLVAATRPSVATATS